MKAEFYYLCFLIIAIFISIAIHISQTRVGSRHKIRNIQALAALQVFGALGVLIFSVVYLYYEGYLDSNLNVLGVGAVTVFGFSKYSPLNNAFSFMTVAYRTEFRIDDWIKIKNPNGELKGKVKDFNLKGIRLKTFDLSEIIISNDEALHSFVINLTPKDTFRWESTITIAKTTPGEYLEQVIINALKEHELLEHRDLDGDLYSTYLEVMDSVLEYKPEFRRMSIYTFHSKYIETRDELLEPNGYEIAYIKTRNLVRDICYELDEQSITYASPLRSVE